MSTTVILRVFSSLNGVSSDGEYSPSRFLGLSLDRLKVWVRKNKFY